jgi:hypothetical protein
MIQLKKGATDKKVVIIININIHITGSKYNGPLTAKF